MTRQLVEGAEREAELPFGAKLEVTLARRDIVTPVYLRRQRHGQPRRLGVNLVAVRAVPARRFGKFQIGQRRRPTAG